MAANPRGRDPSGSVSARAPYASQLIWTAWRKPVARTIQPIALRGRCEISQAPDSTNGKITSPWRTSLVRIGCPMPGRAITSPDSDSGMVA